MDSTAAFRILDANLNRATEGMRVIEEFARFGRNDSFLAAECKSIRHDLAQAMSASVDSIDTLAARDTIGDVGTSIEAKTEYVREDLVSVMVANGKRVEQSLRVIEEYAKVIQRVDLAKAAESIRYRTYSVNRAIVSGEHAEMQLSHARLYVLIDGQFSEEAFEQLVKSLCAEGVHVIQLRDKALDDRALLQRARVLRRVTRDSKTLFIMNDRPDLAALSQADGVHVGQEELSVGDVRSIVGTRMLVGVSTHSIDQARQAVLHGASYIGCGPTFPSGTKSFDEFPGVRFLRQVQAELSIPAFAIGGIDETNLREVLDIGWRRVAVSGAIQRADNPGDAARSFLRQLSN